MAFFSDTFTDTDAVLLQNHTPTLGTSWTRLWGTTNTNAEINANQCRSDGDLNSGVIYTADATYPSADYDITCTMVSLVGNDNRPIYLMVRVQDQENMYAVRIETTTGESSLYKKVSGTWTAVGSLFTKPANGSVIKLEIIGTALKFYDDGVELASATVSDISAAGKAGIGFGGGTELVISGDDGSTSNIIDTLSLNDLGTSGVVISCSVGPLGLAEHSAVIVPGAKSIACTPGALSLAEHGVTIVPGAKSVVCTAGALGLNEHAAAIVPGAKSVACAVGALGLNEHAAAIMPGTVSIACAVGALALSEHSCSVQNTSGLVVACSVGALAFSEHAAHVSPGSVSIACGVGALAMNEHAAAIMPGTVSIACAVGALGLVEHPAAVQVTSERIIVCTVGALGLQEYSAFILVYGGQVIDVDAAVRDQDLDGLIVGVPATIVGVDLTGQVLNFNVTSVTLISVDAEEQA